MKGKEKKWDWEWKGMGRSLPGAILLYMLLQPVGAVLISSETVGQDSVDFLVSVCSALAVGASLLVCLRHVKRGRLVQCLGVACTFVAVIVLVAVAAMRWESVVSGVWVLLTGAVVGAVVAALIGGERGRRRKGKKR